MQTMRRQQSRTAAHRPRQAAAAVRTPAPAAARTRQGCACGGSCPRCRAAQAAGQAPAATQLATHGGEPLGAGLRRDMEARFGHDFSGVRLHTGAAAQTAAAAIDARAYTLGQHIVFGAGAGAPHSASGRRVLAHELVHTLQQRHASPGGYRLGAAGDPWEREAERLSRQVLTGGGGGPVTPTPLAAQRLQREQTDAGFEGDGIGAAISSGTLHSVAGVHGSRVEARDCHGRSGCPITFAFNKAYVGDYAYAAAGRDVRGAYVQIDARHDASCWHCQTLEIMQVVRNITRGSSGFENADPGNAVRRERSGWSDASAPSRGWRIDRLTSATDPYYSHGSSANPGSDSRPARFWDAPGDWTSDRNSGKELQTCLLCAAAGTPAIPLACVTWGYYIDSAGAVTMRPATPSAACGTSTELRDAAARWDAIQGNQSTNLGSGRPPGALGDFNAPSGPDRVG
ncbi:DUF4157 domain-containing protein [Plasticicumulans acidivorans]|uniref:Uncharacterized protein DUF4157 n=1 Tax=Plasticicumulans acidivorans TaxID=886464 RepID=A0A317MUA2_9GAMM|nr:DUF4157 domain-containing protein [Plasticicumulans acidivorans]PWV61189.1 uncharacterized protein DUF4157 [Plasticicumulans acidivorans]